MSNGENRGGPREGAGRKPIPGSAPIMKSVKLSREHWDAARRIGEGNAAEGIRRALDAATHQEQTA